MEASTVESVLKIRQLRSKLGGFKKLRIETYLTKRLQLLEGLLEDLDDFDSQERDIAVQILNTVNYGELRALGSLNRLARQDQTQEQQRQDKRQRMSLLNIEELKNAVHKDKRDDSLPGQDQDGKTGGD